MGKIDWQDSINPIPVTAEDFADRLQRHYRAEKLGSSETYREQAQAIAVLYPICRWSNSDRLTYRVTKNVVELLTSTFFEDVRLEDIEFPGGSPCFQVVGEKGDSILQERILFAGPAPDPTWKIEHYFLTSHGDGGPPLSFHAHPDFTIGAIEEDGVDSNDRIPWYLSIVAAIGILEATPELSLIRQDVLNRDRQRYEQAVADGDLQRMQTLEQRAIRRGKNIRIISDASLALGESELPDTTRSQSTEGTRRPHFRKGHLRTVRYGVGRRKIKLQYIKPTFVGRDKSAPENSG